MNKRDRTAWMLWAVSLMLVIIYAVLVVFTDGRGGEKYADDDVDQFMQLPKQDQSYMLDHMSAKGREQWLEAIKRRKIKALQVPARNNSN